MKYREDEQLLKGIVISKEKYFTFLKKLFASINQMQKNYNWLITGHECYPQNKMYAELLSKKYCWITGDELTEMHENEDFQWIWGVFSAFPKDISKEDVLKYELPKSDGYKELWQNPVSIQHPLAEIEIIAWDSSMTVVISRNDDIVDLLSKDYLMTKDLEYYNDKTI